MPKGAGQKLKLYYLSRIMLEKTDEVERFSFEKFECCKIN